MNIYHHRRTADEPVNICVGGESIQVINYVKPRSGDREHELPENEYRKRNLTDADKDFITEIERYIQNLVHHVNQAYLLNELYKTQNCQSILMNRHKLKLEQRKVEDISSDNLHYGVFLFNEGEFEPKNSQVGFRNDLVWSQTFDVHYRVRERVKRSLARPLNAKGYRVQNRSDMYIYYNKNFDYGKV